MLAVRTRFGYSNTKLTEAYIVELECVLMSTNDSKTKQKKTVDSLFFYMRNAF